MANDPDVDDVVVRAWECGVENLCAESYPHARGTLVGLLPLLEGRQALEEKAAGGC